MTLRSRLRPIALALAFAVTAPGPALAGSIAPRPGWAVHDTGLAYQDLLDRLTAEVKAEGLIVVTQAGPTGAARARGIDIPGNRVVGVFNNHYAVDIIRLSVPAMIEAPVRFYVTEDDDGTATLSYKLPSTVFAPYVDEAGLELARIAEKLDAAFAAIAARTITP